MYGDLVYATPGLKAAATSRSTSRTRPSASSRPDVERTYSPRADVTIVRDKGFGVPHVYGTTRAARCSALGYAAAEDRLFFMDVLRHAGRGELSSFAGGAQRRRWTPSSGRSRPTPRPTSQRQVDQLPRVPRRAGRADRSATSTTTSPASTSTSPRPGSTRPRCRASTPRSASPQGPDPWKRDRPDRHRRRWSAGSSARAAATSSQWSQLADALDERFGRKRGRARVRATSAPPRTPRRRPPCSSKRFPYQAPPKQAAPGASRAPDPARSRGEARHRGAPPPSGVAAAPRAPARRDVQRAAGLGASESESGHPLMVAGPQVAYFTPQILMEEDVHAPGERRTARDRRPAAPRSSA